jgi:tetratricopeptide (TPR) repeat protein
LLLLGYPEQAEKAAAEALIRVRQTNLPTALLAAQSIVYVYLNLRIPKVARAFAQEAIVAAERSGLTYVSALWRGRLGSAIAAEGNPQEGVRMIHSALKELSTPIVMGVSVPAAQERGAPEQRGYNLYVGPASSLLCAFVKALSLARQFDEAIAEADALLANQSNLARYLHGEVYFLKGEAIGGRDASASDDAEACFRKAIEIARGQSAKWWELRATVNLARLLRDTNRHDEARAMLAEIYDWFTEGFDTADLKDAKALLDELSA